MENKRFEIAFTSKEGNKVKLTLSANWLIADSTAAEFKKVMKEYFMNDTDTDKISGYAAFIREKLETWNKAENGKNKTVKSKLSALDMLSGKKASKKSDFEKAANIILKNAKKSANTNIHNAIIENDNVYITDSFVIIRTSNRALYNGFTAENGLKCEQLFTSFSNNNDICKVFIPDIETVKANQAKGKKNSYFVTSDHTVYNINLIYAAMLALSFDNSNNCYAYKKEDNVLSLLYLENTENNTSALIMPIKPRETALMNAVQNNTNVIISCDENNNVIGIMSCNAVNMETVKEDPETDNNSVVTYDTETETAQAENDNNNVLEYLKAHYMPPVSYETVTSDINVTQTQYIISDNNVLSAFCVAYSYYYNKLYYNESLERKSHNYMYAAECFMKEYSTLHTVIAEYNNDFIVSDKELIAYGITLKHYLFNLEKYGYALPDISFLETKEEKRIYKIAGIDMYKDEINDIIENKQYIIKGHSVYYIVETKKGYTARKVYTDNDTVPLVNKNCYQLVNRDHVNKLIRFPIKQYYA